MINAAHTANIRICIFNSRNPNIINIILVAFLKHHTAKFAEVEAEVEVDRMTLTVDILKVQVKRADLIMLEEHILTVTQAVTPRVTVVPSIIHRNSKQSKIIFNNACPNPLTYFQVL